jgi:hypothetical protein
VLGAVFAVVLAFAGGLWVSQDAPTSQEVAVADRADAPTQGTDDLVAVAPEDAPVAEQTEPAAPPAADLASPFADEGFVAAASPSPAPPAVRSTAAPVPEAEGTFERLDADAVTAPQALAARLADADADDVRLANAETLARESDDELRLLYLRLREMQDGQAGLGWDTPPVALGAAPDSIPAGSATGWMQVRVEQ